MNKIIKILLMLVIAVGISSCSTGYAPSGMTGGYDDNYLGNDCYSIYVSGNGYTHFDTIKNYFYRRAKDICLDKGYNDYNVYKWIGQGYEYDSFGNAKPYIHGCIQGKWPPANTLFAAGVEFRQNKNLVKARQRLNKALELGLTGINQAYAYWELSQCDKQDKNNKGELTNLRYFKSLSAAYKNSEPGKKYGIPKKLSYTNKRLSGVLPMIFEPEFTDKSWNKDTAFIVGRAYIHLDNYNNSTSDVINPAIIRIAKLNRKTIEDEIIQAFCDKDGYFCIPNQPMDCLYRIKEIVNDTGLKFFSVVSDPVKNNNVKMAICVGFSSQEIAGMNIIDMGESVVHLQGGGSLAFYVKNNNSLKSLDPGRKGKIFIEEKGTFGFPALEHFSRKAPNSYLRRKASLALADRIAYYKAKSIKEEADEIKKDQPDQALIKYMQAYRIYRKYEDAYIEAARLLKHSSKEQRAISTLVAGNRSCQESEKICFALNDLYMDEKQYGNSKRLLEAYSKIKLDNEAVKFKLVKTLQCSGDKKTANKLLAGIVDTNTDIKSLNKAASLYMKNKQYNEAISLYRKKVLLDPESLWSYDDLAKAYLATKMNDEAEKVWEEGVKIIKDRRRYSYAGIFYKKISNVEKAIECFTKNVEINSDKLMPYKRLSDCYLLMNKKDSSEELWENALGKIKNKDKYEYVADFYKRIEKNQKAKTYLNEAIKEKSDNVTLYKKLADINVLLGNTKAAEETLLQSLDKTKNSQKFRYLAEFYSENNNIDKAIKYYEEYLEKNPKYIWAYKSLANLYLKEGRYVEGDNLWKRGLEEISSEHKYVNAAGYYEKAGKKVKAQALYKKYKDVSRNNYWSAIYLIKSYISSNNPKAAVSVAETSNNSFVYYKSYFNFMNAHLFDEGLQMLKKALETHSDGKLSTKKDYLKRKIKGHSSEVAAAKHFVSYLKKIQSKGEYANWKGKPYDMFTSDKPVIR
jgi:tetratricopeptide (TPR) repeat protein